MVERYEDVINKIKVGKKLIDEMLNIFINPNKIVIIINKSKISVD